MRRFKPRRPDPTTDKRTPDERLEAVVREKNPERALRMMDRITAGLDTNPEPAPWIAAARTLSERLIISEDAFYYFVEIFGECLIADAFDKDPELVRLSARMREIQAEHGLRDDETFETGDAPPAWAAADDSWNRRSDQIVSDYLRAHGHADVAALRDADIEGFLQRTSAGWAELFGGDEEDDEGYADDY